MADLNDAKRTTCDGGTLNRSAYWVPAFHDGRSARTEYVDALFYYKTGYHVPASAIRPPPEGLRMIAGDALRHNLWRSLKSLTTERST